VPNLTCRAMENPGAVTINENLINDNMSVEDKARFY
jgi:aminopeptidase N